RQNRSIAMLRIHRLSMVVFLICAAIAPRDVAAEAPRGYSFQSVSVPGALDSSARKIDASGRAVGSYAVRTSQSPGFAVYGFVLDNGAYVNPIIFPGAGFTY